MLPLGRCDIKRRGEDVTLVTSGAMVWHAMLAAKVLADEGITLEVADVQSMSPLDEETIGRSACKTGRVILLSEACRSYGPTGEWAAVVVEKAFDYLKAPIIRLVGRNSPIPFADSLEKGFYPESLDVVNAVHKLME